MNYTNYVIALFLLTFPLTGLLSQGLETEISKGSLDLITSDTKLPFPNNDKVWWSLGNDFSGDFEVTWQNFASDFIISRTDMIIQKNNGFIGIGELTPDARLHVLNNDSDGSSPTVPAAVIGEYPGGSLHYGYLTVDQPDTDTNQNIARFRDDGATQVAINRPSATYQLLVYGDALATGGMWVDSDRKLKKNIKNISSALSGVRKIKPSSYHFKTEINANKHLPEEEQFGFIAQDLLKVYPNLVRDRDQLLEGGKNNENKILSVNYNGLIPIVIAAIQELDQDKTNTSARLSQLNRENALLKERVSQLEVLIKKILSK